MCGNFFRDWALLLLVLCFFSLEMARAENLTKIPEDQLIEELTRNSEELAKKNSELTANLDEQEKALTQLKIQLNLLSGSIQVLDGYSQNLGSLLTETRILHENYVDDMEKTLKTTRIETWFWRIAAGIFASVTVYLAVR